MERWFLTDTKCNNDITKFKFYRWANNAGYWFNSDRSPVGVSTFNLQRIEGYVKLGEWKEIPEPTEPQSAERWFLTDERCGMDKTKFSFYRWKNDRGSWYRSDRKTQYELSAYEWSRIQYLLDQGRWKEVTQEIVPSGPKSCSCPDINFSFAYNFIGCTCGAARAEERIS